MTGTSYTDPSGLDPSTTSTAADQVRLGLAAMQVPALAAITAESTAVVPVAGVVRNTNVLLGRDGIVGLKTGSTPAAGGCLLVAAWQQVNGHNIMIVAATFGQPGTARTILPNALRAAHNLVLALDTALEHGAQASSRDDSEGPPLKGQAERAMARRWFIDLLGWAPFKGASASAPRASPGARLAAGRHPVLAPDLDEHVMAALHG